MRSRFARLDRHLDAIARERRPRRFDPGPDEMAMMRAAAELRAGHPGALEPSPTFVDDLARRLRREPERGGPASSGIGRRRFLQATGLAAAGAAAGLVADRLASPGAEPDERRGTGDLVPEHGQWVAVLAATSVPAGRPVRFTAGSVEGFLVTRGGRISAISAICTHMGCRLDPDAAPGRLLCPCHGSSFSLDGTPAQGAYALASLPRIRSRVRDGTVEVFVA